MRVRACRERFLHLHMWSVPSWQPLRFNMFDMRFSQQWLIVTSHVNFVGDSPHILIIVLMRVNHFIYTIYTHSLTAAVTADCWLRLRLFRLELELQFFLRPTVSRPVSLGIGPLFGTLDQILSCSSFVGQLRCSAFNASSLTRERVCNLLLNCFWALPEQSHFSRSPTELRPNLTVSSETPPTWRARFPYLYSPGTGWPSYTPGHWVPFLSPLTTRRDYSGSILTRLHTGVFRSVRVRVTLQLTVSQSVCLGVEPNLGLLTRDIIFFFFLKVTVLYYLGRPLWREVGSVICQSTVSLQ
jgi:hypothetical protein